MKKIVMVVCFALCGSLAFAQARHSVVKMHRDDNQNLVSLGEERVGEKAVVRYNASIFSKTEENDTLFFCDFSKADETAGKFTFGASSVIKVNDSLDGVAVTLDDAHRQDGNFGYWYKFDSSSVDYLGRQPLSSKYRALYDWYYGRMEQSMSNSMDTSLCSSDNGWMFMEVYDMTGTPNGKAFNAYIQFKEFEIPSDVPMIDVQLFQWYMKYYDKCYVDYCAQDVNTTVNPQWYSVEINVTDVDVIVNGTINGIFTYTMPAIAIERARGQNDGYISMRLRWYSNAASTSAGYGYAWMVDDFRVVAGGPSRVNAQPQYYTEGLYQQIPQGLQLPIFWHAKMVNAGNLAQNNATASIYEYVTEGQASLVSRNAQGTIAYAGDKECYIDPAGRYGDPTTYGWYGASSHIRAAEDGNPDMLNTSVLGDHFVYAQFNSVPLNSRTGDTIGAVIEKAFDTIYYKVGGKEENGYVWGHDNGILTGSRAYIYGYTTSNGNLYITETSQNYEAAGYSVSVRYTMGDDVPVDDQGRPWVIKGVEYVPATDTGIRYGDAVIQPTLSYDSLIGSEYVTFNSIKTGVGNVPISDETYGELGYRLNHRWIWDGIGYMERGSYPTITVKFPEQPELEAGKSYRVGYSLVERGKFAVAASAPNYYVKYIDNGNYDSIRYTYFANDTNNPEIKKYASRTAQAGQVFNQYDVRIYDPTVEQESGVRGASLFSSRYYGYYPMIYLLVGPREEIAKYNVEFTCNREDEDESLGTVYDDGGREVCGTTDEVADGGTYSYTFRAGAQGHIEYVKIDGETVWTREDGLNEEWAAENDDYIMYDEAEAYENDTLIYFGFINIDRDHEIEASFGAGRGNNPPQGIRNAESNIAMNLLPNPATTQLHVTLEGVTGMVDGSLIDMSGRVVNSFQFNAEQGYPLSLAGVAKGAYFVRITNSQFSKVEKLIVR